MVLSSAIEGIALAALLGVLLPSMALRGCPYRGILESIFRWVESACA